MKRGSQVSILFALLSAVPALHAQQVCPNGNPLVAPDSRYEVYSDGTVRDSLTRLTWKQCSEGQSGPSCAGNASVMNWQAALTAADSSTFAGFGDWRLPNSKELFSLVESGCYDPAINPTYFPNTPIISFWSSTSYAGSSSDAWAWVVYFASGTHAGESKTTGLSVRLVRGGS